MKTGYFVRFAFIVMLSIVSANAAWGESYCMREMCYESDAVLIAEKSFDGNVPSAIYLFDGEIVSFLDLSRVAAGVARNGMGALLSAYGEGLITGEGGKIVSVDARDECADIEALFGALTVSYRFCGAWSESKKILRIVTTGADVSPKK